MSAPPEAAAEQCSAESFLFPTPQHTCLCTARRPDIPALEPGYSINLIFTPCDLSETFYVFVDDRLEPTELGGLNKMLCFTEHTGQTSNWYE